MKTLTLQSDNFKQGLHVLEDDSLAPLGSARKMQNCIISDRGGITPRPGTIVLGDYNDSDYAVRGLYNFRKSKSNPDILLKAYDDELEYFHPTLLEWAKLKDGFTQDQEMDFTYSLVNTDNDDFTYFNNRYEEYQRWSGALTQLSAALVGGELAVPVDTVLTTQVYESQTATSNSTTTVTITNEDIIWSTDMYKNFYIYFPSSGKIRAITANTADTLTFTALLLAPGNVAFEIRQLAFPLTGEIIYNGTSIEYTALDVATEFPVLSAHAADDNAPVAVIPTEYIAAPRGNRIDVLRGRVYVGRVRSAISRDSDGDLQGSTQAGSIFVSHLLDPTTFTFAAGRIAGEGDIINVAYGGGDITDIQGFEDQMAIYKEDYIELVKYTEDVNDTALRTPLKTGVGSVGRVIKGTDDHYFMTKDKKYTSLGRVRLKDTTPQTENFAYPIKRLLDTYGNDNFNGIEYNNRLISSHKTEGTAQNDVMMIYNQKTKSFEGVWSLGANNFDVYTPSGASTAELIYGESNGANTWKMFQSRKSDVRGTDVLPYTAIWQSNFFNALPIKSNFQALNSIAIEGYIAPNTTYTYKLFKDFETESSFSFDFSGLNDDLISGTKDIGKFFGGLPMGMQPMGTIGKLEDDGRRRFSFLIYFPYIYGQYFSSSFTSTGVDYDWEVIRIAYGLKEDVSTKVIRTKAT